ncbi:MAG: protein kinase [Cyanobacteria bacterium]|nr:protein kinase [Cyanobacteriota bacterium]
MHSKNNSKIQDTEQSLSKTETDLHDHTSPTQDFEPGTRVAIPLVVPSGAQRIDDRQTAHMVPADVSAESGFLANERAAGHKLVTAPAAADEIVLDYSASRPLEKKIERVFQFELWIKIALGCLLPLMIANLGFWDVVDPLLAFIALFAAVSMLLYCNRPKICLNQRGIRFRFDGLFFADYSPCLEWDTLTVVDATDSLAASSKKQSIDLCFQSSSISPEKLMIMPIVCRGYFTRSNDVLHLNLRVADLGVEDRQRLRQALLKYSKPGAISVEAQMLLNPTDPSTYTALWLDSLSALPSRVTSDLLEPGTTVANGRYSIVEQLASGGQATIYKAIDHLPTTGSKEETANESFDSHGTCATEAQVALKEFVLPTNAGVQVCTRALQNIEKEAELLRKISHPQVVGLRDVFVEDHRGYLVMQYISGQSLRALSEQTGPLSNSDAIKVGKQMAQILLYLHTLTPPVVHRDFTPENLMLTQEGELVLIDFNVAHELEGGFTRTIVGKHSYIPPEQFRGEMTTQSDIYAFGATMFFLLTGTEPEPITQSFPQAMTPEVGEGLNNIVARCTALDLSERFGDVKEVLDALCAIE